MTLDFCSLSWVNQVRNTRNVNRTGQPTGYKLIPGSNCLPLALPEAKFLRRAGFLKHNLWVTTYKNDEMFPGGEFPNQNPRIDEGLATWVKKDRSLEETNIVLWHVICYLVMLIGIHPSVCSASEPQTTPCNCRYVFGLTHIPRLEDWPVMPVERIGFMLMVPSSTELTFLQTILLFSEENRPPSCLLVLDCLR